jgi:hypothetical protein
MFQLIMFHYIYMPLPFLFSAPSLGSEEHTEDSKIGTYQKHYLWNGMLYSLFFVQHVVMSLIIFKLSLKSLWNKYPLF